MIRLRVWANARPMGWFGHASAEFFFEYDAEWLAQPGAHVLAPQFALGPERYTGMLVRSFFDNLLPEGEALEDILAALHLRGASHFDVLGRLGQELPGVLSLLPPDAQPVHLPQYVPLPYTVLSERLAARQAVPLLVSNDATTMSLAGHKTRSACAWTAKPCTCRTAWEHRPPPTSSSPTRGKRAMHPVRLTNMPACNWPVR